MARRAFCKSRSRFAGQPFELECVWRGDGRQGKSAVTEEFTDAGRHVNPRPDIANHRIARVGCLAVGRANAVERAQSRLADLRLAEVASQKTGAAGKHADRLQSA